MKKNQPTAKFFFFFFFPTEELRQVVDLLPLPHQQTLEFCSLIKSFCLFHISVLALYAQNNNILQYMLQRVFPSSHDTCHIR